MLDQPCSDPVFPPEALERLVRWVLLLGATLGEGELRLVSGILGTLGLLGGTLDLVYSTLGLVYSTLGLVYNTRA